MPHTGRHSTERARFENEHAVPAFALVPNFKNSLQADKKIVNLSMLVRWNTAAGLYSVHCRLHRRIVMQGTFLATRLRSLRAIAVMSLTVMTDFWSMGVSFRIIVSNSLRSLPFRCHADASPARIVDCALH
jgi:hypothetical protein